MNLISPDEFKKKRNPNNNMKLTPPTESKRSGGSSLNLISPEEFKTKSVPTSTVAEVKPFKIPGVMSPDEISQLLHPSATPTPEPAKLKGVLDLDKINRETTRSVMVKQAADKQARENIYKSEPPIIRDIHKGLDQFARFTKPVADVAMEFYTPGAGLSALNAGTQAAESLAARAAPELAKVLGLRGGRVAQTALREAAVGVPTTVGNTLAKKPEASNKELLQSAEFGAVGGALLGGLGRGAVEGVPLLKKGAQTARKILEGVRARRSAKDTSSVANGAAEGLDAPGEGLSGEVAAMASTPEKPTRPLPELTDNYLKPLSHYSDTMYRETSPHEVLDFLPGSNRMADTTHDAVYLSNRKDLALGQGTNKGVMVEFDPTSIQGQVNRSKPAWEMAYNSGDAEFIAKLNNQKAYQDAVKSVTIAADVQMDKVTRMQLKRVLADWEKQVNPDGSTTFFVPGKAKAAAPEIQAMSTKTIDGRPLLQRGSSGTGESVGKVTKRSDIIADLSKALNVPIRTGRYRNQAHGVFKVKPGVVRSKLSNDLPVISHEIGHALDKRYKLSSSQYDGELLPLGKNTSDESYSKAQVRNEGVAEFFRLMLTNPEEAQRLAPGFHQRFLQAVSPKEKAALMKAQVGIRQYIDQDILTKSFSEMSVGQKEKRKLPSLSEIYTKFVDELNPIKQLLKPLGEKGKRIFEDFWLLRGATGKAQAFLKQGRVDAKFNVVGKSFDDVIKPVKKNLNEFRAYIKDKRAVELADRKIMTGSDLKPEERLRAISKMEQLHPEFVQAHMELKGYQDALLKELIDSGVLDAKGVAGFKALNEEYVPFFRVFESEAGAGAAKGGRTNTGSGAADQYSPIKRIKGSDREIVDPLESIIKNTHQYITIAERNKAMRSLIDGVVGEEDLGGLVEKIPTPMQGKAFSLEELRGTLERAGADPDSLDMDTIANIFRPANVAPGKENVISVFRDGKREFYQLDPDLYRAVTAADKEQMHSIVRALNFPVRILRSGIVNTLEFWVRNILRDQPSAYLNSNNGYIPFVDMVRGMYHVLGKTDTFTKFLSAGGAQGLRQSLDRRYLQNDMRSILATSMKDKSLNILKNPLEAMRALSEASELGTRVGEFSKGIKKNGSAEGIRAAALSARDLIDFGRAGTVGRDINKVSAFWNAQVQGLDKTIRTFKKHPVRSLRKAMTLITVPTAALYYKNKDDPRYQELPQWDKDLFWHAWIGKQHFRIPIPFELGVAFKVLPERLLGYSQGQDEPFREFGKTTFDAVNVLPDISALTPWIEAYSNKNFLGAPIVPRREEDLLPEDQAGPYTSGTAKLIAKIPGINNNYVTKNTLGSPRKIDHIIRGYAGSLGQYGTQIIDKLTDAAGITDRVSKPKTGLSNKPLFKAITGGEFGGSTDSIDKFYERFDKLTEQSQRAEKGNGYFEGAGELKRLTQIKKLVSQVSKQIRTVQSDPDMTPKEKTDQIRRLNLMSNNFARMALGLDQLDYEDVFK